MSSTNKITEEWIEKKAVEIYNYLYYETFNLNQVKDFIRSLFKEVEMEYENGFTEYDDKHRILH